MSKLRAGVVAHGLLLVGLVVQLVGPAPVAAAASTGPTSASVQLDVATVLGSLGLLARNALPFALVSDTSPAPTHDVSPSTPWTSFAAGVNVVAGNLVLQGTDLSMPSVGFGAAVSRTYSSAAAARTGPFGVGWFWSFGVHVVPGSGSATVVREDGRADVYTQLGSAFTAPPGIYDQLQQNPNGSFTLIRHDQVRYSFTSAGLLQQIADLNGNTLQINATAGLPSSLTDTDGRTWTLQSDAAGHISGVTDPAGRTVSYSYNATGDLILVTDATGGKTQYAYDLNHRLTQVTDANSHVTTYAYDGQGRATTVTDAATNASSFSYDSANRKTTLSDPLQHARSFTYDAQNRVTGRTDALGHAESATWDAANNRTAASDRNGNPSQYAYDARGNLTSTTDPLHGTSSATFDTGNRPLTRTDPLQRTTTSSYDPKGNLLRLVGPAPSSHTITYTYDAKGQRLSETDPNQRTTTYAYNTTGDQISTTDALNHTTSRTFDAAGRLLTETDPDGRTTSRTYDALGRLLSTTDGAGEVSKATYDAVGNKVTSTDPLGHISSIAYDARNLPSKVTDPLGGVTQTTYDAVGNKTSLSDPLGHKTTLSYDAENRLSSATDPNTLTSSSSYDPVGNQLSSTDPLGRTTTFAYDALNRLTQVTDPLGGRASYAYDAVGNRTSTTDPNGHASTTSYDELNRPISQVDPATGSSSFSYDGVDNLLTKQDTNGKTTYQYDAANRLTRATYPEGPVSSSYNATGDRTQMVDQTGTTSYTYDGARRLTSNAAPAGTTTYSFDLAGNLTRLTSPDNTSISYAYDGLNRAVSVTDPSGLTSGYSYDAASRKTGASRPNGTRGTFTYDTGGRLTSLQWSGPNGGSVAGVAYTYDAAGNRTKVVDSTGSSAYTYDRLDRLTQANYPDGSSATYAYDPAGNRTSLATTGPAGAPGSTTFYSYDSGNRLQNVGSAQVTWDGNGNQASTGATVYSYDSQNRLLQAKTPTQTVQMAYDGANRRTTYSVAGAATSYAYDEHSSLARVLKETNTQHSQLYGLGGEILWDNSSDQGTVYFHQDALGSTIALTKPDGTLAGTRAYDAFGATRATTGLTTGSFWFAGEQLDPETSLIYLRARYYDPSTGRFLQADPATPNLRDTQSLNSYVYARNNPLKFTDPTGRFAVGLVVLLPVALWIVGDAVTNWYQQNILDPLANNGTSLREKGQGNTLSDINDSAAKEVAGDAVEKAGGKAASKPFKFLDFLQIFDPPSVYAPDSETHVYVDDGKAWTESSAIGHADTGRSPTTHSGVNSSSSRSSRSTLGSTRIGHQSGGAPIPVGRPPNKPSNVSPTMWNVQVGGSPTFQWAEHGSPDGRPIVASKIYVYNQGGNDPLFQSPWVSGNQFQASGLPYWILDWNVAVMDDRGLVSEKSDRWGFTLSNPNVTIIRSSVSLFAEPDNSIPASATELVGIKACTDGNAHNGISMRVSANEANDGSKSGAWDIVAELGVWCFDTNPVIPDHPNWRTLPFADGPHWVRIEALHSGVGGSDPNVDWDVYDVQYTLPHRRPATPELVAPGDTTYTNSRSVTFQWKQTTNAQSYRLRASTNADPKVSPVLDQTLPRGTLSYTYTFGNDYPALNWNVEAIDDVGANASGTRKLGIDRTPPTASVTPLATTSSQSTFLVRWTANDAVAGVKCTDVQVRDGHNGGWSDWYGCITQTFSLFQGEDGHPYYFRARATDNAGNQGSFTSNADGDANITVNLSPPTWWNPAYSLRRPITVLNNDAAALPAGYVVRLRFDGATQPTAQQIFDNSHATHKCDDVRVVHADTADLDRLVVSCTSSLVDLLFRSTAVIPPSSTDNSSYQLYYSNAVPASPLNSRNQVLYPTVDSSVLGAYDMLEGTGLTLGDASGHGNATMNGAVGWQTNGKFGPAVVIPTGSIGSPAISAPGSAGPSGAFTIETWIKRTLVNGRDKIDGTIAAQDGLTGAGPRFVLSTANNHLQLAVWPSLTAGDARVSSQANIDEDRFFNAFHHLAVTFDGGSQVRFYIDGVLDSAPILGASGLSPAGPEPLAIGSVIGGYNLLTGLISGFAISQGLRTDFGYGQFASVVASPTTAAGSEQVFSNLSPPVLSGLATLQGRTTGLVRVDVFQPGTTTGIGASPYTAILSNGAFQVPLAGVSPGTYDIEVKHAQSVSRKATLVGLVGGVNSPVSFGRLLTGDADNNNHIDIFDYNAVVTWYGKNPGDPSSNPDFDGSGIVDIFDYNWVVTNFGKRGPLPAESTATAQANADGVTTIPSTPSNVVQSFSPQGNARAYVSNFADDTVSVVETGTNSVVATVPVGNGPALLAAGGGRVYVPNFNAGNVSVIEQGNNSVAATIAVGTNPLAIAISPNGARAYVVNAGSNTVSVIDTAARSVITSIAVGSFPRGVTVSPDGLRVYVSNGSAGTVSVIDTTTNTVAQTVSVGAGPFGVVVDQSGRRAYVVNAGDGTVSVIDTALGQIVATVAVAGDPWGASLDAAGSHVLVTRYSGGLVAAIDTATNMVTASLPSGSQPWGIGPLPGGARAYVANSGMGTVSVVDTVTNQVVSTVRVGARPVGIAVLEAPADPSTPITLLAQPQRLVDTRSTGGPIAAGESRCFTVVGQLGIPSTAAGVVLNVTAVGHTGIGWLRLYPAGASIPATSTLNFDPHEYAIANGTLMRVGTGGQVCVQSGTSAANVILDAVGYLADTTGPVQLLDQPQRLVDTRSTGGPIAAGESRCFTVVGQLGIPSTAAGVVLNVTAVGHTGIGWLRLYPAGASIPATSTLNFDPHAYAIANGTFMRVGTGGQVCVQSGTSAANVILDAVGYLAAASGPMQLLDQPQRLVDTRSTGGPIAAGESRCFTVVGQLGIPSTAAGVVLNVTAVGHTSIGWLRLYPAGAGIPATSTLNFDPQEYAIANGALMRVGTGGQVCVQSGTSAANVILDAVGYLP